MDLARGNYGALLGLFSRLAHGLRRYLERLVEVMHRTLP